MPRKGSSNGRSAPRRQLPNGPHDLGDEKHPDDLFGGPETLETLPLSSGNEASGHAHVAGRPASEAYKIGPGKPPLKSRWVKGAASPNPRGRPPKKKSGRVKSILDREIQVSTGGCTRTITRREALDRSLRQKAIEEGGGWKALWEAQQDFDRKISERIRRSREKQASLREISTATRVREQIRLSDFTFALFERVFPGLLDTMRVLGPDVVDLVGRSSARPMDRLDEETETISSARSRQIDARGGAPRLRRPRPGQKR